MPDLILSPNSICSWRDTPWDSRSFNTRTREILSLKFENIEKFKELISNFEAQNVTDQIGLCYTRLSADDKEGRSILETAGYRLVEQSYALFIRNLTAFYPKNTFGRDIPLRPACLDDKEAIQKIAADDFAYGRFAEDPKIPSSMNALRQRNWIADMLSDPSFTLWVYGPKGAPKGFHAFRRKGDHADMVLTGMNKENSMLAGFFWSSCLAQSASQGVKTASTMISAANLPIVNLYAHLGFRFDKLYSGFHKHYEVFS